MAGEPTSYGYPNAAINSAALPIWLGSAAAGRFSVAGPNDWKVSKLASLDRGYRIEAGTGSGDAVTDVFPVYSTGALPAITGPDGTYKWFLIVARRNWAGIGTTIFTHIAGTSEKRLPPRSDTPGTESDQPLALARVQAGSSVIEEIIDLRVWLGPGGAFAKDDLVRSYLTSVGTVVNINGNVWSLLLGGNDLPGWVRLIEASGGVIPTGGGTLARSDNTANINFGDTTLRVNIDQNTGGPWSNRRGSGLECPVPGVYFISGRLLTEGPAGRYGTGYITPDKADMVGSMTWTEDSPGAAYGGISFSGTFICPTGPAFWFATTAYNAACGIRQPSRVTCTRISKIG